MKRSLLIGLLIALALILSPSFSQVRAEEGATSPEGATPIVRAIDLEGNRKIDSNSIKARIQVRIGDALSMTAVREDIRSLYAIGYFETVQVDIESFDDGVRLVYVFTEKPTLAKVEIVGNKEITEDAIKKDIPFSAGSMMDFRVINDNVEKIKVLYESEGFSGVTVYPIVRNLSKDAAALTIHIHEGEKVQVDEVILHGNSVIPDDEIKAAMETKEGWLFSFATGSGKYVRAQMRADLDRIRNLYHSKGYITAQISEPELTFSEDREELTIALTISEGEQYQVANVAMTGIDKVPAEEVQKRFHLKSGDIFSRDTLREDILAITDYYADQGYSFADVVPDLNIHEENKTVDLTIHIAENNIVKVDRIRIVGNRSTRDKVVRREVRLDEGDIYHPQKLKRTYNRINNLNFFESVEIVPEPRPDEGTMDITIRVKERPTGSFSVGGGYSSIDGFLATAELIEGNLFGRGQSVKVKGEVGSRRQEYYIRFTEPWLFDEPISMDATIYNQSVKYFDYTKSAVGFSATLGKSLTEYLRGTIGYSFERATIKEIASGASAYILEQEGERDTSKVTLSLRRDSLDNRLYPREGSVNAFYASLAGLGGDNAFYTLEADTGWYFPLFTESAFAVRARAGMAEGLYGKDLPIYERFYVGSINTVRGFKWGAAGPLDETGEVKGGKNQLIFNIEYTFPLLSSARLYAVTFYDRGASFAGDDQDALTGVGHLREAAGAGIRWISPIGPLRLEWGKNLNPKGEEDESRWDFSFGTFF